MNCKFCAKTTAHPGENRSVPGRGPRKGGEGSLWEEIRFLRTVNHMTSVLKNSTISEIAPHVPHHEIIDLLGQGSSARVWRARHVLVDQEVALKVALGSPFDRNGSRYKAFLNEALLTRSLRHRNIIRVFDVSLTDTGEPVFSMEVANGTLEPTTALTEKVSALSDVAGALDYLHQRGVVHCDVKPSNVLRIDDPVDPRWVLADLGLAWKEMHPVFVGSGSFGFVAPERFTSEPPTIQSDVYSFARLAQVILLPEIEGTHNAHVVGALLHSSLSERPQDRQTNPVELVQQISDVLFRSVDEY
jgi:serine/threonine protein kinase